jgi:RNase adapter protein RapZ
VKLVIVSGLSGSGKSVALHTLEDEGYYSVDNLHLGLLKAFVELLSGASYRPYERAAVGIDARTIGAEEARFFPEIVREIRSTGVDLHILFFEAEVDTLIKRFSETRRKHPLTHGNLSLVEAIHRERTILAPIASHADLRIDTTKTNVHQLRTLVRERVCAVNGTGLSLLFQSFGYKHGVPSDSDLVFDVRCLPNPHWEPTLRNLTGRHRPVIDYLGQNEQVEQMYRMIRDFVETWTPRFESENRSYLSVSIGCTGGQHRSVYIVERLGEHFRGKAGAKVLTRHREID